MSSAAGLGGRVVAYRVRQRTAVAPHTSEDSHEAWMRVLAISGSLRAASSNTILLRSAVLRAPPDTEIEMYEGVGGLPHFNPDLDRELDDPNLPAAVRELRERVAHADAILISSPEYAHGVPGALKNALDWLVGGSEVVGKPVALLNLSSSSRHAQASLAETLRTMSANVVAGSPFLAPAGVKHPDGPGAAADPAVAETVHNALAALRHGVRSPSRRNAAYS